MHDVGVGPAGRRSCSTRSAPSRPFAVSGGHVVEVSDAEIYAAQAILARESGLLVEPAGATAYAGVLADAIGGALGPSERVIVVGTGAGYKDEHALVRLAGRQDVPRIAPVQIREVLDERS